MTVSQPKRSNLRRPKTENSGPEAEAFRALTRRQKELQVKRSLAILEAAEDAHADLSAVALSKELGYENRSHVGAGFQKVKQVLPRVASDGQKIRKAIDVLHQSAIWENEERNLQANLKTWFAGLSPQEKRLLVLTPQAGGHPEIASWELNVIGTDLTFALGHSLELPRNVMTRLTADERSIVEQRQKFWTNFGLSNGGAIKAFIEDHFDREDVRATGDNPVEIEWLLANRPEAADLIKELEFYGNDVTLLRCNKTPDSVGDSIRHIAVKSQHKFVTTWLPHLLRGEADPQILHRDIEAVKEGHKALEQSRTQSTDRGSFRNLLLKEMFAQQHEENLDFEGAIRRIKEFRDEILQLQATGQLTKSQREQLEELNQNLSEGLGSEFARRRLIQDDANRTSCTECSQR